MIAPVAPCPVCGLRTPYDWERCGWCGAQRLLAHDGVYAGHRRLAPFGRRLVAGTIDIGLFLVPAVLSLFLPRRLQSAFGGPELFAVLSTAALLYPVIALGARGRTRGKRTMGIHVVTADGRPLTYPRAAIREGVGRVLELLLALPLGLASAASIPFDERRQAIHDKMARTVVVVGDPVPRPPPVGERETPEGPVGASEQRVGA